MTDPLAGLRAAMAEGPVVIGQIGQTLDGRIATASGHSHYVNGPDGLDHLHRLRALVDAVLIGAGTVALDDPSLTTRRVPGRNPVRVVLDPDGRVPADRKLFTDGAAPTLVLGPTAPQGIEAVAVDSDPASALAALRARGLTHILVEGGTRTLSAFLAAGALDRLHVLVAPKILGSGRPGLILPEVETMAGAIEGRVMVHPLGQDTLFDVDLRAGG